MVAGRGLCLWEIIIGVVLFMALGLAHAFDGADVQKLKTTKRCRNCDLTAAELPGLNLAGADLSGANLTGANLTGANLLDSNLAGADVKGAKLTGATWTDGRTCARDPVGTCR